VFPIVPTMPWTATAPTGPATARSSSGCSPGTSRSSARLTPGIDRATYFERCWPNAASIEGFEFVRVVESGDELIVTYESTKTGGRRFRNTEVLTLRGDQICRAEVYFGWDL